MSFSETIFLFVLALIIFGPKKLPEMARQAGKLLAELRRASNEFRSQIETEIAHIEVENKDAQNKDAQYKQTVFPPTEPPQGTVASLSVNPAVSESIPHLPESTATLAAPTAEPAPASSIAPAFASSSESTEAAADDSVAASQESHV